MLGSDACVGVLSEFCELLFFVFTVLNICIFILLSFSMIFVSYNPKPSKTCARTAYRPLEYHSVPVFSQSAEIGLNAYSDA